MKRCISLLFILVAMISSLWLAAKPECKLSALAPERANTTIVKPALSKFPAVKRETNLFRLPFALNRREVLVMPTWRMNFRAGRERRGGSRKRKSKPLRWTLRPSDRGMRNRRLRRYLSRTKF